MGPNDAGPRVAAVLAGFEGREAEALAFLADEDAGLRALALGAIARLRRLTDEVMSRALSDPSPIVRRRAAELSAHLEGGSCLALLEDPDPSVIEAACFATGELREEAAVPALCDIAEHHEDPLCRESAVAALGAIGHPAGLGPILAALKGDRATVRRRAVIALAPFDTPEVQAALEKALGDRDWQVRQAAEDQLRR